MIDSHLLVVLDDCLSSCDRAVYQHNEIIWQVNARINSSQCDLIEEFIEKLKLDLLTALDKRQKVRAKAVGCP